MTSGRMIESALDLKAVKRWTERLHSFERRCSHSDFTAAAKYCAEALAEAGFENIELLEHRADGRTAAFDCAMPPAWDLRGRSLLRIAGEETILADTDATPFAAAPWSAPTPPGGITAELAAVRPGEMPDVRGKWVLLLIGDGRNPSGEYLNRLRENGAVGVAAADLMTGRDYPDAVKWFNGIGRFGWYPVAGDVGLPLFSISARNAMMLSRRLEAGETISLHGAMNTETYEGGIYTVTAVIPGRSELEYALFSHIYEPFAGDNSVGFGVCCGIGQFVRRVCGTPEKTLRVVFSMELYGLAAYLSDPERSGRIAGALNMDALNHRKQRSLKFVRSPLCAPWFGDWVLPRVLERETGHDGFAEVSGTLGDDTFPGDPLCGGVPVNWCLNPSGTAHHCGCADFEPDWDWAEREVPGVAAAVLEMLQFDAVGCAAFPALAEREFSEESRKICAKNIPCDEKHRLLKALLDSLDGRLASAEKYCGVALDRTALIRAYRNADAGVGGENVFSPAEQAASAVVPIRLKATPFSMIDIPREVRKSLRVSRLLYALFDGERTLLEAIRLADWAQGQRTDDEAIRREAELLKYFERYGYIKLRPAAVAEA